MPLLRGFLKEVGLDFEALVPTNINSESSKVSFRKEQNKQPSRRPLGPDLEKHVDLGGMTLDSPVGPSRGTSFGSMLKVQPLTRATPRAMRGQVPRA